MANEDEGVGTFGIFRASLLCLHLCTVGYQFYEIIFLVDDDDRYEILFRKIHCGSMATTSLLAFIFYNYGSDSIRSSRQQLQKIDYHFESVFANEYCPRNTHSLMYIIFIYIVLIIFYIYTGCLRGHHIYANINLVAVLKDSFIRTYFVVVNAFMMLNFVKHILDGKNRLDRLNGYFNTQISTGRHMPRINELNDMHSIYFQIVGYCDSVRKCNQVPIFMILTSDVFAIIYMILIAFHEFVSKSVPMWAVLFCVADPFVRVIQTVIVISTAEAAVFQTHRWSDTLQRMMIECKMDIQVREVLRLFLMEMIDKKLVFVICGFFKLSHETLVAMLGTVSTYLLIMMQFQPLADVEEESRTEKSKIF